MTGDFRHDLRSAFDELSGPADPGFSARVHAGLVERAEDRQRPHWTMAVAAAAIAVILVGALLYAVRGASGPPSTNPHPAAAATPSPLPSQAASPIPSPSGTAIQVPQGYCAIALSKKGAQTSPPVKVTAVRVGAQGGFDRFVIEFDGLVPPYDVTTQASPTFAQDASGQTVTLQGTAGVKIVVHGATGAQSYSGPNDLFPGGSVIKEARQIGDFEGVYSWGVGVGGRVACVEVTTLASPSRLVVDVYTPLG